MDNKKPEDVSSATEPHISPDINNIIGEVENTMQSNVACSDSKDVRQDNLDNDTPDPILLDKALNATSESLYQPDKNGSDTPHTDESTSSNIELTAPDIIDLEHDLPGNEPTPPEHDPSSKQDKVPVFVHTYDNRRVKEIAEKAAPVFDVEVTELRQMLFQPEIDAVKSIQERLSTKEFTKALSNVIAEAIEIRSSKDDNLKFALSPILEESLKRSVQKNSQELVNILFPLMGPSLRKSISANLRSMLSSLQKSIEMSFSLKGLKWRVQALRSGQSFSEVVLLNTVIYRVDEVYFIHSETGIDIAHVAHDDTEQHDSAMVSAMLTAIQDFVRDCFSGSQNGELESMRHGEYTILVEQHPLAYIACIIRGTPPNSYPEEVQECLDYLLTKYHNELVDFSGDPSVFSSSIPHLEKLLGASYSQEEKPLSIFIKAIPIVLILLILGFFGKLYYDDYQHDEFVAQDIAMKETLVKRLQDKPGLLVFNVDKTADGPWKVFCLKDTLAPSPESLLEGAEYDPALLTINTFPYIAYDHEIVTQRVEKEIFPPDGAEMEVQGEVLILSGTAPMHWILKAYNDALRIPGIERVDTTNINDPRKSELDRLVHRVEIARVTFIVNKAIPVAEDQPVLSQVMESLAKLEYLATEMGITSSLTIYGHADSTGSAQRNYEVSQERAKLIAALLYARGSSMPVAIYGMGADYASKSDDGKSREDQDSRYIEFRVHLSQAPTAPLELLVNN